MLDENDNIIYGQYRRHMARTQATLAELLTEAKNTIGECSLRIKITGSGAINLAKALEIGFVQEVVAVATALKHEAPQTDVAIELGGEDAKIIDEDIDIYKLINDEFDPDSEFPEERREAMKHYIDLEIMERFAGQRR